jgi:hypothetical protein
MLTGQFLLLQQPTWTPFRLGASLIAWWDAERTDLITQSGGLVSSWKDAVSAHNLVQSSGSVKPAFSATSFNGRPGLTFDGTDDAIAMASLPAAFPTGANPSWLWGVVEQNRPDADTLNGDILQYGSSSTTALTRRILRARSSAVSSLAASTGDGTTTTSTLSSPTFNGRHVVVGKVSATDVTARMDATSGTPAAKVSNTTASQALRVGAAVNGGDFWLGVISAVLVTLPLGAADEARMFDYFNRRL